MPVATMPLQVNPADRGAGTITDGSQLNANGRSMLNPSGIDYSKYAGMSPFDVQTRAFPGGLPTNWDWNQWMSVNPGAGDPRTTDNRGGNITPAQLAQFSPGSPVNYGAPPPAAINPAARPANPNLGAPPVVNPASRPANPNIGTPVLKSAPDPTAPAPGTAPPVTAPTSSTTPNAGAVPGAYAVSPTYGASQFDNTSPAARVTGALARRFKPDGWFY